MNMFALIQADDLSALVTMIVTVIIIVIIAIVAIVLHFLPFIIALLRHHHDTAAIFILNLLLGWTVIGWVIALVWSFTGVRRQDYR
jgi:Superinfection immunity protein